MPRYLTLYVSVRLNTKTNFSLLLIAHSVLIMKINNSLCNTKRNIEFDSIDRWLLWGWILNSIRCAEGNCVKKFLFQWHSMQIFVSFVYPFKMLFRTENSTSLKFASKHVSRLQWHSKHWKINMRRKYNLYHQWKIAVVWILLLWK